MKANIDVSVMTVTPEMASEWLQNPWPGQRQTRQDRVDAYASDMLARRWGVSPDAICRIKGMNANGQHRLWAVVKTGKPQTFLVMDSNDENLYKIIDAGLRRTVADGLDSVPYAASIPSIARWVRAYDMGAILPPDRSGGGGAINRKGWTVTHREMIEYCRSNHDILAEAAAFAWPLYSQTKLLPVSVSAALYVIASRSSHLAKTKEFLTAVYTEGGNSAAGDLHNRLVANRGSKARLKSGYIFGITIKALKAYIGGKRPSTLRWGPSEELPAI